MTAWQVVIEDIECVLCAHGVTLPGEQITNLLRKLDTDAIIDGLLYYDNFCDQCLSALSDIEDQLIRMGVIDSDKQF